MRSKTSEQSFASKDKSAARKLINGSMRIAAAASSIALCSGLLGCGSKIDSITNYLQKEQYDEAVEAFGSLKITDKNREEILSKLSDAISSAVTQYAADEVSYEHASGVLEAINKMHVTGLDSELAVGYSQISSLYRSKEAYSSGVERLEAGDYLSAYSLLRQVIESDRNYENAGEKAADAMSKYEASVIASARAYADEHDYEQAVEALQSAMYNVPDSSNLQSEIQALVKEQEEYLIQAAKDEALSQAESYAADSNYESALEVLNAFKEAYDTEDSEVDSLYDEYSSNYVSFILEKAKALRDNKQYLQALEMLNNASQVVPSPEFSQLIAEINAMKPTYLCEVKCQNSFRYDPLEAGSTVADVIGNTYNPGNLFVISSQMSSWSSHELGFAEYYLGYKYNKLEGIVAVGEDSVNVNCTLTIEGDGVILQTIELTRLTVPTPVSIDVSSVNVLKVSLSFSSGSGSDGDTFYAILSDFCLLK